MKVKIVLLGVFLVFFIATVTAMPSPIVKVEDTTSTKIIDGKITSIGVYFEPGYVCINRFFKNTGKECFGVEEYFKVYHDQGLIFSVMSGGPKLCPNEEARHVDCFYIEGSSGFEGGKWTARSKFFARHKSGTRFLDEKEKTFIVP